ncbi:FMN-dependent dehydrogenase-domain-containing protein [Parachaetomium inaequale]|uniref:FMN-dependent dehydrogenase-domain-containing protein n=1 Tax=Parachaetomium inaequale TaxID=2588326 RepID=A0AAN6P8X0_9PEZI|nr:FMN-dependent dehydrogenase-domain-containing protein [Parachaetomium inaequale]
MTQPIPHSELASHNTVASLWIAIDGVVYDFTEFAPTHPGGMAVLLEHAGRDGTEAYNAVHSPSLLKSILPASKQLGPLSSPLPRSPTSQPSPTRKPPLSTLISVNDFRLAAHSFLPPKTLAFISSAATDCHTHRRNSTAYSDITLRPRVLIDVSAPADLATTILGQPVSSPIFVAPTSLGKTVHPDGELEIARACRELGGVAQVISTSASFSVADVVQAALDHPSPAGQSQTADAGNVPVFLQLYVDKHAPNTEALLRSLTSGGSSTPNKIKGVFLTVDAPVPGKREADERVPSSPTPTPATTTPSDPSPTTTTTAAVTTPMATQLTPSADTKGSALGRLMASYISPSLTWQTTLPWLRSLLPPTVPLVIKGIQTAADAVRAMEAGADGIVLSNHGGRSLDTSPATVLVLLELQRCCPEVFERVEVYVDGGVGRGADVFKALCLGARGVGVGRGVLYGLGYGREGVKRVLEILNDELVTTMKMCGVTSLDELHPGLVNTRAVDHLVPDSLSEEHPYAKWRRSKL